jgi:hypothetical protein
MFFLLVTAFFPSHNYDQLSADPGRYVYDLLVGIVTYWVTSFATMTGLIVYVQKKETGEG